MGSPLKHILIQSLGQVDELYAKGINICRNCRRESCASCENRHVYICTEQAMNYADEIIKVSTTAPTR